MRFCENSYTNPEFYKDVLFLFIRSRLLGCVYHSLLCEVLLFYCFLLRYI